MLRVVYDTVACESEACFPIIVEPIHDLFDKVVDAEHSSVILTSNFIQQGKQYVELIVGVPPLIHPLKYYLSTCLC